MRAIQSTAWGQPPTFTSSAPDPPAPSPSQIRLKVLASGLHRLVRSQALGQHYSARHFGLPYIPGSDGVGLTPDGRKVYFVSLATGGGFAEFINVEKMQIVELSEGADAVKIAGLVNPGMSSWMALSARTTGIVDDENKAGKRGWTVVILGATTQSGKVAIHFARELGAQKVIGVARDATKLEALNLDDAIVLAEDAAQSDWSKMGDVDVILDYLYGVPAVECLKALASKVPTQYVQIGSMAGLDASWPSAVLRSKNITLRGSGPGAWTTKEFAAQLKPLIQAVEGLENEGLRNRKLEEIDGAWADQRERTVFIP